MKKEITYGQVVEAKAILLAYLQEKIDTDYIDSMAMKRDVKLKQNVLAYIALSQDNFLI